MNTRKLDDLSKDELIYLIEQGREAFDQLVQSYLERRNGAENRSQLFCDLKTDEEKATFFLTGRGYETGVIAKEIQNDVALAYHLSAEYAKELQALRKEAEIGGKYE